MRNFSLELNQLKVFMEVAKDCNMTRAAQKLDLTQPAISTAIKKIENGLGIELFDRASRPMRLTAAGHVLFKRGNGAIELIETILADMYRTANGKNHDIRLGCSEAIMNIFGGELVSLLASKPGRLTLSSGTSLEVSDKLRNKEIDISLSTDPLTKDDGVQNIQLLEDEFLLVIPKEIHDKIRPKSISDLNEFLEKTPYVRAGKTTMDYFQTERLLRTLNFQKFDSIEIDSCLAMAIVVAEGNGWAILPTFSLLQASYFLPQLSFLSFKGKNAERRFYISYEDTVFEPTAENISSSLKTYLHEKVIPMVRELKPGLEKFIKA